MSARNAENMTLFSYLPCGSGNQASCLSDNSQCFFGIGYARSIENLGPRYAPYRSGSLATSLWLEGSK